ncbi:MAG: hypothetical protein M1831_001574 [Alyxoria varia]|nr:MAG: hypothetical protein M1831_001574 [Alyxoria varia]
MVFTFENLFEFQGNNFNGASPDYYTADASSTNWIYIKFHRELTKAEENSLHEEHETVLSTRLGFNAYLCFYRYSDLEALRRVPFVDLEALRRVPFVDFVNCFPTFLKTSRRLKEWMDKEPDRTHFEIVVEFADMQQETTWNDLTAEISRVAKRSRIEVLPSDPEFGLTLKVEKACIPRIEMIEDVKAIKTEDEVVAW